MAERAPFGEGLGHTVDQETIVATFPMSADFEGWRIAAAEVDESGYFLTVTFTRAE